jgi:NAD(P)H-flavin reductase
VEGFLKFTAVETPETHQRFRRHDPGMFEYSFKAEITSIHRLTGTESLYRVRIIDAGERTRFSCKAGQFVMLEVPGIGEAPFSISSPPGNRGDFELCVRNVGNLTGFLARAERGLRVGIRGPFGTSFPMEEMHGQNVLLIAGGLGLAPLRAPLGYVQENRSLFRTVEIIYGAKHPSQLLFAYEYELWRKDDLILTITVDRPDAGWKGPVGTITDLLRKTAAERDSSFARSTYAVVCGPPVMFTSVCALLREYGLPMQKLFVSLERRMHCGMGKCCRCNIGSTYTCLSGPVFDYWTVMNLKEAI